MQKTLLFLSVLLLAACQPAGDSMEASQPGARKPAFEAVDGNGEKPKSKENPISGEWNLVAIDQQPLRSGGNPTLVFEDDGSCWGSTGVNKFNTMANFEKLADGWLELGPAAVTRMAGPPEAMALEKLFLDRLSAVSSFKVEGDTLHLYAGDAEAATFQRVYR